MPEVPKHGLIKFIWSCTEGVRGWILLLTIMVIGIPVQWKPFISVYGGISGLVITIFTTTIMAPKTVAINRNGFNAVRKYSLVIHCRQYPSANFTRRFSNAVTLDFHRLMLGQSLGFYQDEFAGVFFSKSNANSTGCTRYGFDDF